MENKVPEIHVVGKRKTSIARIWLKPGVGRIEVNKKPAEEYFKLRSATFVITQHLRKFKLENRFDIRVNVRGGGQSGQAQAIMYGIAKGLVQSDESLRPELKKLGALTRDARKVERKKYGQPGARKRFQYSKR